MDFTLNIFNAAASGLIALTLIGAVLSPRIDDGVIVKVGLIAMVFGFGSIALRMLDGSLVGDGPNLGRSLLLVEAGIAVVIVGYIARSKKRHHPLQRVSDWLRRRRASDTPKEQP